MNMREALKSLYPYPKWIARVNAMHEAQVVATYLRLKRRGKI